MTEPQENSERSLSKSEPEYAGFWIRFVAHGLDDLFLGGIGCLNSLIIFGVLYFLLKVFVGNEESDIVQTLYGILFNIVSFFLNTLIGWLYYAMMESSEKQASLGKLVCRLRITRKDGSCLSFVRASGRFWIRMAHIFVFSTVGVLTGVVLIGLFLPAINGLADLVLFFGIFSIGLAFGGGVGYLPALFTARRQTLHDMIAGTLVVKAD